MTAMGGRFFPAVAVISWFSRLCAFVTAGCARYRFCSNPFKVSEFCRQASICADKRIADGLEMALSRI
jgi:hypothetical protein